MSTHNTPAVQKVVDSVRRLIQTGALTAGDPLPAELALAEELGASRNTVRRAIEALVRAGYVERLPYSRPVVVGDRPIEGTPSRNEIHVWVGQTIGDFGTSAFLRGLSAALSCTPYRMSVREPSSRSADGTREERRFLLEALRSPATAAIVMSRDAYSDNGDVLEQLSNAGMPIVFVDGAPPRLPRSDYVTTANLLAAQRAVEHLIELGHHRIVCLTDDLVPAANQERFNGYRRAMTQRVAEVAPTVVVAKDLPAESPGARPAAGPFAEGLNRIDYFGILATRLAGAVLAKDPRPTALFVTCDALAFDVCAFLEGAGLDIPERISVVGFDGLARFGSAPCDDLTTCLQDFEGFGTHAASLLLDRLEATQPIESRRVLLDAPLSVRSTTTYCLPQFVADEMLKANGA
ncbi:GntR family transcriptional regulator [bacterium]|nr:MAG: GntR family transcriptional regulator [bacterium]